LILVPKRCKPTCGCKQDPKHQAYMCLADASPDGIWPLERKLDPIEIQRLIYEGQQLHQRHRQTGPLTEKLLRDAAEGRTSFLSPETTDQIEHWCRTDPRVDMFWHMFTDRVRTGLNDHIVRGLLTTLGKLLQQWNEQLLTLKAEAKENYETVLHAATDVVKAYDDASARGDLVYMQSLVEELDAALLEIEERDDG